LNPTPLSRDGTPRRPATDPERRSAAMHACTLARVRESSLPLVWAGQRKRTPLGRAPLARAKASAGTPPRAGPGARPCHEHRHGHRPALRRACRASCSCRRRNRRARPPRSSSPGSSPRPAPWRC